MPASRSLFGTGEAEQSSFVQVQVDASSRSGSTTTSSSSALVRGRVDPAVKALRRGRATWHQRHRPPNWPGQGRAKSRARRDRRPAPTWAILNSAGQLQRLERAGARGTMAQHRHHGHRWLELDTISVTLRGERAESQGRRRQPLRALMRMSGPRGALRPQYAVIVLDSHRRIPRHRIRALPDCSCGDRDESAAGVAASHTASARTSIPCATCWSTTSFRPAWCATSIRSLASAPTLFPGAQWRRPSLLAPTWRDLSSPG